MRPDLLEELALWIINAGVEILWGDASGLQKDKILEQNYKDLNDREQTYSKCRELFSKYDNNKSPEENLIKSSGIVNQLILRLAYVIFGRLIGNTKEDSLFMKKVGNTIIDVIAKDKQQIENLIIGATREGYN